VTPMSRKRLVDQIREIMMEALPPSEHADSERYELLDPCMLKDWIRRLSHQLAYPDSLVLQFVAGQHSMSVPRFTTWLAEVGISVDVGGGLEALFSRVLPAGSLLSELCKRYVGGPVCDQAASEILRKTMLRLQMRRSL